MSSKLPRWYLQMLRAQVQADEEYFTVAIYDDLLCQVKEWQSEGVILLPLSGTLGRPEDCALWVDYEDPSLLFDPSATEIINRCG